MCGRRNGSGPHARRFCCRFLSFFFRFGYRFGLSFRFGDALNLVAHFFSDVRWNRA